MEYKNHIEHYKTDAAYFDFFNENNFRVQEIQRHYQEFFSLYRVKRNDMILEIGSGGGYASYYIKLAGGNYFPLDISTLNLEKIKHKYQGNIFPVSADAYYLPFLSGSFDLIILSEVLEHLAEPLKALLEINRVLKKNGSLIVSVPYNEKISYQICIHCNKPTPTNAHLNSFNEMTLAEVIKSVDLEPVKMSFCLNKAANRLHFNLIMRRLPFRIWKLFDKLFNLILKKPSSVILLAVKKD